MNLKKILPQRLVAPLRQVKRFVYAIPYRGQGRYCPVCETSSKRFGTAGVVPRQDARCMICGSLERHRLVWLYFKNKTNLFDDREKEMLHVAPEPCFQPRLKKLVGSGYLTADLFNPQAMVKMDVMKIQYQDNTFDVIYCSHVLEHVHDDKKALAELHRVLKVGGWAVLLVPITVEKTMEDPSITDPEERLRLFGQKDHVRRYGPDYAERLVEAGFNVHEVIPSDFLTEKERVTMRITRAAGRIHYCVKW